MFDSEEDRIVKRIKDFIKNEKPIPDAYIMLRNGRILNIDEYFDLFSHGKIKPQDAYVYISIDQTSLRSDFHYPFLDHYEDLLNAYLAKFGFHYRLIVVPATGLKYVAVAEVYGEYLTIEVSDLLTVVNNLNLPKIAVDVLDGKLISGKKGLTDEEYDKILDMFESQQLFAGHYAGEAWGIIYDYYDKRGREWAIKIDHAKEVARITMDYDRIFHPYKVCYETKKWKEIDCRLVR